ncbi:MAG TPA: carboxypeptidase-like regulatory domain-containing protein [Chitinophagaceae bacterium]|nr:carboxypeptidase-like regulatory domain-containing protein [Chitinophagaceae bacterium]
MKLLLQSLLFVLPVIGCHYTARANENKKQPGDSLVQGVILDHTTKKPVSDVVISLYSKQGRKDIKSDASGFFAFSQLLPGEFTLMVVKDGYKKYRKDFVVPKEGLMFKLSLQEEEEEGADTWNPFRVFFGE